MAHKLARMRCAFALLPSLALVGCDPRGPAPRSPTPTPIVGAVAVDTVARGLANPWALEFLPDGRMLVTERPGRLRIIDTSGHVSNAIGGVPAVAGGQGGLLDVALDPSFASNHTIYLSFAEPGANQPAGTSVLRAVLRDATLDSVRAIYQQQPKVKGGNRSSTAPALGRRSGHTGIATFRRRRWIP